MIETETREANEDILLSKFKTILFFHPLFFQSCDMWSLGVIIYIMLCGYPPFFPETPSKQMSKEMRLRIMGGEYEFPAPEWTHVTEEAKDVVNRYITYKKLFIFLCAVISECKCVFVLD